MEYRKLFELARKSFVSNIKDLNFPMKLNYVLTYRCNAKCVMCNIWKKKESAELTLEEIKKFFSVSDKFSWIDLSGGEIFLRDDIVEVNEIILRSCRSLYLLHFATNGFLPEKIIPTVNDILKLKPPKLLMTVSLDGYRQLHDKMRGIPGGFTRAIETFKRLRGMNSRSFKVFLGMTLTEHNLLEVERSFAGFKAEIPDLKYEELHINIAQRSGHYYDNMGLSTPDPHALYRVIIDMQNKQKRNILSPINYLEKKYLKLSEIFLQDKRCPQECQALSSSCFIDPSGNVYPCNMYDKMIGNIKDYEYDLARLLSTDKAVRLRAEIKDGVCPQCWTPCEAYQAIIANFLGMRRRKR